MQVLFWQVPSSLSVTVRDARMRAPVGPRGQREFDVVIFGATGCCGSLTAEHYASRYPQTELRWAIAGRSASKVSVLAAKLNCEFRVASLDEGGLDALAASTACIASAAGPFASPSGWALVEACVNAGTDYADISGEVPWVSELMRRLQARAVEAGSLIVPFCGIDSVPVDLALLGLARRARARFGPGARLGDATMLGAWHWHASNFS